MKRHRIKNCGSCRFFIKPKNVWLTGLCELKDWGASEDGGHDCQFWKGIKYKRNKLVEDELLKKIKSGKLGALSKFYLDEILVNEKERKK